MSQAGECAGATVFLMGNAVSSAQTLGAIGAGFMTGVKMATMRGAIWLRWLRFQLVPGRGLLRFVVSDWQTHAILRGPEPAL